MARALTLVLLLAVAAAAAVLAQAGVQADAPVPEASGQPLEASEPQPRKPVAHRLHGTRPNVIVLFVDDFGWGDVGSFWPEFDDTPNIDRLAAKGMRLYDFHAMSLCTPSRASLMTGRLGKRTGVVTNFGPFSLHGLPLNETTLAEALNATYHTAMTGKWHLGIQPAYNPVSRGFQSFFGLPMSHDYGCTDHPGPQMECPHWESDRCTDIGNAGDGPNCHPSPTNPWNESIPLYRDCKIIEQPADLWTLCQRYVDFGIQFIRDSLQDRSKPFFLYQAFSHMHVPISHHPNFTHSSSSKSEINHGAHFGDALRELDHHIGRLLTAVEELGIEEDTIIFFTGDNGAPSNQCLFGGSNGPFQGMWMRTKNGGGNTGKASTWEGGHREASIVSWPGRIPANSTSHALTSTLDYFPTIAALAGVAMPPHRDFDGIDLARVLFDAATKGHDTLYHPTQSEGRAGDIDTIRVGPFKGKYKTKSSGGCVNWPGGQAGDNSTSDTHDPPLIFNVVTDLAEASPLEQGSPEYQEALRAVLAAKQSLAASLAADNISFTNYSSDTTCTPEHCIKPCCDPSHPLCVCTTPPA